MKFALVNGTRNEAKKSLSGSCPVCGSHMIPKCGEKKIHHWSHKGKLECDPWRENETQWHRDWKNNFPVECQEIVHTDEITGEKHIADVKTKAGIVLEFQHSPITLEEHKSRNDFYKSIVWVVDGLRVKSNLQKVIDALKSGKPMNLAVLKISSEACSVFKDWISNHAPVFFDFGVPQLVLLLPIGPDGFFYVTTSISKEQFIKIFREPESQEAVAFISFLRDFHKIVHNWNNPRPLVQHLILPQQRLTHRGPRIDYIQNRRNRRFKRF